MKRFMIAVLAVAVLFGFAACDNSNANPGTTDPSNIAYVEGSVRNAKDYLVNDVPAAADFVFTGYDVEGNVVAADMASVLFKGEAFKTPGTEVNAVFTSEDYGTVEIPVTVYDVDEYTLTVGANAKKTYYTIVKTGSDEVMDAGALNPVYADFAKVDTTGLSVTASYNEGKTREITNFTAEIADWTTADPEATVTVKVGSDTVDTYTVSLLDNAVESIYFDVTDDYTIWFDEGKTADTATISATDVVLYGKMLNGQAGYTLTGTAR